MLKCTNAIKREALQRISEPYCFCCDENKIRKLTAHHHGYFGDSVVYKQFEKTDDGQMKYWANLTANEIPIRPHNFAVLCHRCHQMVEHLLQLPTSEAQHWIHEKEEMGSTKVDYGRIEQVWETSCEARDSTGWFWS